jgi:hypothetical protein
MVEPRLLERRPNPDSVALHLIGVFVRRAPMTLSVAESETAEYGQVAAV